MGATADLKAKLAAARTSEKDEEKTTSEEGSQDQSQEAKTRSEESAFQDWKEEVRTFLATRMPDYRLQIKDLGPNEFIIFQGAVGNIWARFSTHRKVFRRTSLERRFENAGLIPKSNELGLRR